MCKEHHHCSHHQAQECGHCHHEHGNARLPLRIGAAVLLFAAAVSGLLPPAAGTALFVAAWFVAGADIVYAAGRNILRGKWLDENALMTIATLGAVFLGEYPEAAMVMILFQSGEYLQHKAVESSKRSIAELMDIRPDYACREENGTAVRRRPEEIAVGDVIIVKSGEKIPLDGLVTDGEATVDTSALTGESLPRRLVPGSEALNALLMEQGTTPVNDGCRLIDLLRRPQVSYNDLRPFDPAPQELAADVVEQVEITVKYEGYIQRQQKQVAEFERLEQRLLPEDLDYDHIQGLRLEAREKLSAIRPRSLGQAGRISGVSPADMAALMIYLGK